MKDMTGRRTAYRRFNDKEWNAQDTIVFDVLVAALRENVAERAAGKTFAEIQDVFENNRCLLPAAYVNDQIAELLFAEPPIITHEENELHLVYSRQPTVFSKKM